jgi:hypothetical protein
VGFCNRCVTAASGLARPSLGVVGVVGGVAGGAGQLMPGAARVAGESRVLHSANPSPEDRKTAGGALDGIRREKG